MSMAHAHCYFSIVIKLKGDNPVFRFLNSKKYLIKLKKKIKLVLDLHSIMIFRIIDITMGHNSRKYSMNSAFRISLTDITDFDQCYKFCLTPMRIVGARVLTMLIFHIVDMYKGTSPKTINDRLVLIFLFLR